MNIKTFVFNGFHVNNYVVYDETKECVIIDPACYSEGEKKTIEKFITQEGLKPVALLATHCHIDHILGLKYLSILYKIKLYTQEDSMHFINNAQDYASFFGFHVEKINISIEFIKENDIFKFGNSEFKVLFTPGHADGSLCFYSEKDNFLISGDVLFNGSIGRTDLHTGNHELLIKNIKEKILVLPENVTVYSGHGPTTSIGYEKKTNPFL